MTPVQVPCSKSCAKTMADKDEAEKTIAEDLVVTKYKMAGAIVNRKKMIPQISPNVFKPSILM